MIGGLTDVVCNKAPKYARQFKEMGHNLSIAINLSVDSLTNLEWPDRISPAFHVSLGHYQELLQTLAAEIDVALYPGPGSRSRWIIARQGLSFHSWNRI